MTHVLNKPINLPPTFFKRCHCGHTLTALPVGTYLMINGGVMDGYMFNCVCKTTKFIPLAKIAKESGFKPLEITQLLIRSAQS